MAQHEITPIDPEQSRRTNFLLWLSLLLAQVIYVLVVLLVAPADAGTPALPALPLAFAALAAGAGAGAHLLWRRATGAGRTNLADAFRSYVVAWVLDEGIAIFGMVLALLGFGAGSWAPFSAAAFVLMLVHRPRSA